MKTDSTGIRNGLGADEIKQAFRDNLCRGLGRLEGAATKHDIYTALALTVRDRLFYRQLRAFSPMAGPPHAKCHISRQNI
jgi:hypothetical protein